MSLTIEELNKAHNNVITVMEDHIMTFAGCNRNTANLIANEVLTLDREADRLLCNEGDEEESCGTCKYYNGDCSLKGR